MDITNINKGLGHKEAVCHLYSQTKNEGDPKVFCKGDRAYSGYINRGALELLRLNDFVDYFKNLAVIKMDIEGSEYLALKAGRKVFLDMHVPYIVTEFAPSMLAVIGTDPVAFVQEFVDAGYKPTKNDFKSSKAVTMDEIRKLSDNKRSGYVKVNFDLYFTHKDA
jgi:hypothetical protein